MAGVYHKHLANSHPAGAYFAAIDHRVSCHTIAMKPCLLLAAAALAGCVYPPQQKPPAASRTTVTLDQPYDLAWQAMQTVVAQNSFRVVTANLNSGTLEAQSVGGFTLADADCGQLRGIAGKVAEEPDPDASAVYDFHVEARQPEVSAVSVEATFTAPLHAPLRPLSDVQCISRGRQEARLLGQIKLEASKAHRAEPTHGDIRKDSP
jgi:hypothetical protein